MESNKKVESKVHPLVVRIPQESWAVWRNARVAALSEGKAIAVYMIEALREKIQRDYQR
jgi:hypothetical protein